MQNKIALTILALFLIFSSSLAQEKPSPSVLNEMLKEELALAKTPSLYLVFDFKGKDITLKSRGMVLQEWKIESVRFWGERPLFRTLTVVKKSALFAPKRKKIIPGEAEQQGAKFELEALELKDMPATYSLSMGDGFYLYVGPKSTKFASRVANIGHFLSWYLWSPLKKLGFWLSKKPFIPIDVKLGSPEDAKALYWTLAESIKSLVLFP